MSDVLSRLNNYVSKGTDIKRLTEDLLLILKDIVIFNSSANKDYLEALNEEEATELSRNIPSDLAIQMIDILMNTVKDYKNVTSINPIFEITLIKLTSLDTAVKPVMTTPKVTKAEPVIEQKKQEPTYIPTPEPVKEVAKPVVEERKEEAPQLEGDITINDNVIYLKDAEKEDNFEIDDSLMVNVMVVSKKEIKAELLDGWKNIKRLATHPVVGKAATLLIDGRPLVASKNIVVLEYAMPKLAEKVNSKDMQAELQTVIEHIFHRKMFIYGVSRNKSVDLQSLYMNLLQIGRLPKAKDITLDFIGE